jgi:hypothetical protein
MAGFNETEMRNNEDESCDDRASDSPLWSVFSHTNIYISN